MSYLQASDDGPVASGQYFGKYRGVVVDNADPDGLGRLRARVPDILGDEACGWALPCVPYAGPGVGLFCLPPVDALVWIEFENGEPDYPIWTGCFWATRDELPEDASGGPDVRLLRTATATIKVDEAGGSTVLVISTDAGPSITVDGAEITIDDGSGATIKLSGGAVSLNDDALEVR
jgi:uncharacterized protein involved in type VI secretion and phage assembly